MTVFPSATPARRAARGLGLLLLLAALLGLVLASISFGSRPIPLARLWPVSYTHLRAHETSLHLVCRLLLEKKKTS